MEKEILKRLLRNGETKVDIKGLLINEQGFDLFMSSHKPSAKIEEDLNFLKKDCVALFLLDLKLEEVDKSSTSDLFCLLATYEDGLKVIWIDEIDLEKMRKCEKKIDRLFDRFENECIRIYEDLDKNFNDEIDA